MANFSNVKYAPNEGFRDPNTNPVYAIVIRGALKPQAVSVPANTTTKLPTSPLFARLTLLIYNNGGSVLYVGDSTVTISNGMPINPQNSLSFAVESGVDIFGVSSGTIDVRVLETT